MDAEVWAITTRKGGVLKTSLTVNIAGVLSGNNKVLIVDTDSQGNCLLSFGKNPDKLKKTIYDVLIGKLANPTHAILKVHQNIDILPANDMMELLEFEVIPDRNMYPEPFLLMKNKLEMLRDYYDYILIDTPPNSGLIQGNSLMFADKVLVPHQPENYSMRALTKILNTLEMFKRNHNPNLELLGVVATLVDMRTNLHCEIMNETRKYCDKKKIPLFKTMIPKSIRFAASIAYDGKPSTITDPLNKIVQHYYDLVEEVIQIG